MIVTIDEKISNFGERIDELIFLYRTTAKQVAADLDISEQTISNWRTNYTDLPNIGCRELVMLANYFHVTTDFLLGVSDNVISEITPTIAGMLSRLKSCYNHRFANTDAVFSYYDDVFEGHPEMIDLVNKARPKNALDFMLLELYPYPFACNSLWELRDYSECAIKSGNVTIPNWCKEDIAEMEKDRKFFRLCYYFPTGKIIIDDVLQNRPKEEESPDE